MIIHSKQFNNFAHMIWSIFPSFCIYPQDFKQSLSLIAEGIEYYLINVIQVRKYIINGFIHLINKPLKFINKQKDKNDKNIMNAKQQIEIIM